MDTQGKRDMLDETPQDLEPSRLALGLVYAGLLIAALVSLAFL